MDKSDDIIITDFSKITKVGLDHIEIKESKISTIDDALSQKSIFERFLLKDVLSNISEKKSQNCDNSIMVFHTAVFHDETGKCEMTLFG